MKVAIDVREFQRGKKTGIGRMLYDFILNSYKYEPDISLLLLGDEYSEIPFKLPSNCSFSVYRFPYSFIWDQLAPLLAWRKNNFNIYFSPYYKKSFFLPVPSVITVCDLTGIDYPENFFQKNILPLLIRLCALGTRTLTISDSSAKRLKELGIKKTYRVYPAVEIRLDINSAVYPEIIESGKKYFFSIGDNRRHKNMDFLIRAYGYLPSYLKKEFSLVIAGGSEKHIKKLPDSGEIFSVGAVSDIELYGLYSKASLFIFPSLSEGFGLTPLEAMSFGCPVLSSRNPAMPEVLSDAAAYFNPLDAQDFARNITALVYDNSRLAELSRKGKERAAFFSKENFCRGLIEIFKEAIGCAQ
ncbi:MAG: glycosyltransferase family 1 protein [Elusimicrobiota bacterium]